MKNVENKGAKQDLIQRKTGIQVQDAYLYHLYSVNPVTSLPM